MPVPSDRKQSANRENAKKSSGPKSDAGKRRSSLNSFSHGLAIPVAKIAALRDDIEALALCLARAAGQESISQWSQQAAEAELDLVRIRKCRAAFHTRYHGVPVTRASVSQLDKSLAVLERYERRAFSRRKRALRASESKVVETTNLFPL
jgi:hypothetical protein